MVAEREQRAVRNVSDAEQRIPGSRFDVAYASVDTQFFEVRGRLRLEDVVIEERSMVQRIGPEVRTLQRERGGFEAFTPQATQR